MIEKVNAFVGREHVADGYDCADLAMDVAREVFGREVMLPAARPRPQGQRGQSVELLRAMSALAKPIARPVDGSLVLMRVRGQDLPGHIGTWFFIDYAPHVLHTSVALGCSSLHRIGDLWRYSLEVEGYYAWL